MYPWATPMTVVEALRWRDSVKVGGTPLVDAVTGEVGINVDNVLMNILFNDRVGEIGGVELDDCPGPPGCSPLPSELLAMEE